jgi:hypothetical protein
MEPDAMIFNAKSIRRATVSAIFCGLLMTSCGGFGSSNNTSPGNTPNIAAQTSFRIVGGIGIPFSARISDSRSTWNVMGVTPLSIVIVNNSPPIRVSVNKLISDNSLLSLEIINGFTVKQLDSSTSNFGVSVGNFGGKVGNFAPPANPDVRFFVKGPSVELFDALVEDTKQGEIVEARAPALILFDSPAGGNGGRVDATFSAVQLLGNFSIDLIYNGTVVRSAFGAPTLTMKYP